MTGDFKGIIHVLKEVESGKFKGQSLNKYRIENAQIVQSMSYAYFRAWDFKNGIDYVEQNIALFDEFGAEWFSLYEVYLHLAIYSKKYKLAIEVIDTVIENKNFEKLSLEDRGKWEIYNAYLQLFYLGNFYQLNFNFKNLIESIPAYDKDREGLNVAVIIFQFLYFIEQKDLEELAKRRDELKSYMANHFKENFSYRSRTIYKLLNIAVENKLDLKAIQVKSRYLVKKLSENQIVGDAYQELEIVPYEHLWDLILKMIKNSDLRGF